MVIYVLYNLNSKFCDEYTSFSEIPDYNDVLHLMCSDNYLRTKDIPILPEKLEEFYCDNNNLTHLPELLDTIKVLWCYNNRLKILAKLPKQLNNLDCKNNILKALHRLPELLEQLICSNNHLIYLPELPKSLTVLNCNNNKLTYLPKLPKSLKHLDCRNNYLAYLPELPKSLNYLVCYGNKFITKQEDYLQKIIYCLSPNKERFIKNLFGEFSEKCLKCDKLFLNVEKYKFLKSKKMLGGIIQHYTIKNQYCPNCQSYRNYRN